MGTRLFGAGRGETDLSTSIAGFIITVLILLVWTGCTGGYDSQEVNFRVDEKERTQEDYLVWVTHVASGDRSRDRAGYEETMEVDDHTLITYHSSDTYGRLEVGQCYNATVFGRRIPYMSRWRNITHVHEIDCPAGFDDSGG